MHNFSRGNGQFEVVILKYIFYLGKVSIKLWNTLVSENHIGNEFNIFKTIASHLSHF